MKSIAFTGGGTAGHVIPNLPLMDLARAQGFQIVYFGAKNAFEEQFIRQKNIPFYPIACGKLRRYFSLKTLLEPFKIFLGIGQAYRSLKRLKIQLVFSKGGFVAFPVVVAAWLARIPVIAHESDKTPGLANRLSYPFVSLICVSFDTTLALFKNAKKAIVTGTPIRTSLLEGDSQKGLDFCQFDNHKPCILVMGGSMGAQALNTFIRRSLKPLTASYNIIHLCGKGKIDPAYLHHSGYKQLEYADENLNDLLAAARIIISRAGANALFEILALKKPHILIPLPKKASRGDQIENAFYFAEKGVSLVLEEEALSENRLVEALDKINGGYQDYQSKMQDLNIQSAATKIFALIEQNLQ